MKSVFPTDSNAAWFAKHLHIITTLKLGHVEASVDDMMVALFHSLGFNEGDLITVYVSNLSNRFFAHFRLFFSSRNRLMFEMSNHNVHADADLTVFNIKTLIRLALVEVSYLLGSKDELQIFVIAG
jgi:hypothetical protein